MIRVLMLDLGGTLITEDEHPYAHVPEALETIQGFETGAGEQLHLCLISDFHMPTPQRTAQSIFQEYITLLENLNLKRFFEPVGQHVTLSTHAGVYKPDPRVFQLAIERLGLEAGLDECLFITENADHIAACQALGMKTLRFDEESPEADFGDWSQAPPLIAQMLNLTAEGERPDEEEADEVDHYVKTLDENKQISRKPGPLAPGETHRETVNEKGEKRIKRERFSAI